MNFIANMSGAGGNFSRQWSNDILAADHIELQASAMGLQSTGNLAMLAGRKYLALVKLDDEEEQRSLGKLASVFPEFVRVWIKKGCKSIVVVEGLIVDRFVGALIEMAIFIRYVTMVRSQALYEYVYVQHPS